MTSSINMKPFQIAKNIDQYRNAVHMTDLSEFPSVDIGKENVIRQCYYHKVKCRKACADLRTCNAGKKK